MSNAETPVKPANDSRRLFVFLCAIVWIVICVILVNVLNLFSVLNYWINLIIPAGAILFGIVAGVGFMVAGRLFSIRPTLADIIFVGVIAAFGPISSLYLFFKISVEPEIGGNFLQFMEYIASHSSYSLSGNSASSVGSGIGLSLLIGKGLGAGIGAMIMGFLNLAAEYCENCQAYMKKIFSKQVFFPDIESLLKFYQALVLNPAATSAKLQDEAEKILKQKGHDFIFQAEIHSCPKCQEQRGKFQGGKKGPKNIAWIKELRISRKLAG